ncbi:MAG: dihydropteroate synthase [Chitinophagales bacterium]
MTNTISCQGKLISLEKPLVMGILNLTPDSFYDGGENNSVQNALNLCEKMLDDGAKIIDIGAISTRPSANFISEEEELKRLSPIIAAIVKSFPEAVLSIDTFRAKVAEEMVNNGAAIINDISGGIFDNKMFETVAKLNCPYILMHLRGNFETMHSLTNYNNVTIDVIKELSSKINKLISLNVSDILIDPGFGFSKTIAQNFELLNNLEAFCNLIDKPVLAGLSRKSMIWKTLDTNAANALNGTTALNMVALQNGAKILRVHDVKEAVELIKLYEALNL